MILYPFAIYGGMKWGSPRALAACLLFLWVLRAGFNIKKLLPLFIALAPAFAILVPTIIFGKEKILLFFPSVVSLTLLLSFARTLLTPPSMVELFASLQVSDLSIAEIRYCQKVTKVWCLFFMLNALFSIYTALQGSLELWMVYNGGIVYGMMGVLFSAEYVIRNWYFPRHLGPLSTRLCKTLDRFKKHEN